MTQIFPRDARQEFQAECFADRGYRFLRKDGADSLWKFSGFTLTETVRIKPDGTWSVEERAEKAFLRG